jgi:uncharacterized membrane protein YdbT with pleckstrin-like domain
MEDTSCLEKLVGGARENERVLMTIHRHWFDLLSHLFMAFVLAGVLFAGFLILPSVFPALAVGEGESLFFFLETLFLLFVWIFLFLIWIDVWFDTWIITSERIINIEQKGFFSRETSELSLSKVQDVTSEVDGVIRSILNYGDVFVQTAGEEERFHFRSVPDPVGIKSFIMKLSQGAHRDDIDEAVGLLKEHRREK